MMMQCPERLARDLRTVSGCGAMTVYDENNIFK